MSGMVNRELGDRVVKDAVEEVKRLYPKRSGHWRRKQAEKLALRRLADLDVAGRGEAILGSMGLTARIKVK